MISDDEEYDIVKEEVRARSLDYALNWCGNFNDRVKSNHMTSDDVLVCADKFYKYIMKDHKEEN